ncbi:MAG: phosphatase PAP2 family protein [Rhodoferax sp.]|nr:phosphatase PAP2 family protein [Actinomycetota bacterium]
MPTSLEQDRQRAALWLLLVAAGCALLVLAVDHVFVLTARGQLVDSAGLEGAKIGRSRIIEPVHTVLDIVSVGTLAAAGLVAGGVALLRRRLALALVAVGTLVGSNVTTQLLKYTVLQRPDLSIATQGMTSNTLPSGHTTVAMSVAAAALLVAPARLRGTVAVVGAAYGAATGVATLSAGYHRPSDAVAAALVVGAWAAGLGAIVVVAQPPPAPGQPEPDELESRRGHPVVGTLLGGTAATLLAVGGVATYLTAGALPGALDRAGLLLAYGGGAALIAGTAVAVVAALVVVVHRIAPPLPVRHEPVLVG